MKLRHIMVASALSSLAPLAFAQQAQESVPPQHPQAGQTSDPEQQFKAGQGQEEPGAAVKAQKEGAHSPPQTAGSLDQGTIKQVQEKLNERGYDVGTADGIVGPKTQAAIKEFQQSEGIEATGELNQETLAGLGVEGETMGRGEGAPAGSSTETGAIEGSQEQQEMRSGAGKGPQQRGTGAETGAVNQDPDRQQSDSPAGLSSQPPSQSQQ